MDAHFYQSRCKKEKNRHPLLSVEILREKNGHPLLSVEILMEKIRTPINFFTRKSGYPFLLLSVEKKWTPTFISRDINGEDKDTHKFLH